MTLASIPWDPHPVMFTIPYVHWPVRWYGFFFALGFFLAYSVVVRMFKVLNLPSDKARHITDRLCWYSVIGTIVGARLGYILFYDLNTFIDHPIDIFKTWEGGLASHGGVIGIILALVLFHQNVIRKELPKTSFLNFTDLYAVAVPLVAFFIRLGNFFNQEIIGTPSTLPWSIAFGHPYEGIAGHTYHPVQLYEGLFYLATFFILAILWSTKRFRLKPGLISGIFFILVFGSRFLLEFIKMPQGGVPDDSWLQMGQILSIPCILAGFILIYFAKHQRLTT